MRIAAVVLTTFLCMPGSSIETQLVLLVQDVENLLVGEPPEVKRPRRKKDDPPFDFQAWKERKERILATKYTNVNITSKVWTPPRLHFIAIACQNQCKGVVWHRRWCVNVSAALRHAKLWR